MAEDLENIPTFDDKRIKEHPDKVLLDRIRKFFKTFTTGDFEGMRDLQSEDYTMTNIREMPFYFSRPIAVTPHRALKSDSTD